MILPTIARINVEVKKEIAIASIKLKPKYLNIDVNLIVPKITDDNMIKPMIIFSILIS